MTECTSNCNSICILRGENVGGEVSELKI